MRRRLLTGRRERNDVMLECQYAKEPVDLRLLALRLWKQAGIIVLAVFLGVLIFGGGYYLREFVFAEPQYAANSLYQVEYVLDPVVGSEYTYINGTTWNQWMGTKEFLDLLYENLAGSEDAGIDRETMKGYLSARLQMDLRMPDTTVTTPDPQLSLRLAKAVEQTMADFAGKQKGIDNIRVVNPAADAPFYTEARPLNACILSGVVTLFLTVVILCIKELGQDSIWLPAALKRRYGLKTAGTVNSPDAEENLAYLFQNVKRIGVLPVGTAQVPEEVINILQTALHTETAADAAEVYSLPCAEKHPQVSGRIREMDALLLSVEAGPHMGRRLESVLDYLALQECAVTGAILAHADERLIGRYYWRERLFGRPEKGRKEAV